MRVETVKVGVIPSTSPSAAYASDLARLNRSGPIGPSDDSWLLLAHALHRFGDLSDAELELALPNLADTLAVNAISSGLSAQSPVLRCAQALRALNEVVVLAGGNEPVMELFVATQAVAEAEELAGAYGLAYVTLSALMRAFSARASPRLRGHVMAQLGRAARQIGANDVAQEMYEDAMQIGYDADALDVVARALLGLGVLALTRGNFPGSREQFERALVNAEQATDPELIRAAHHGLLHCGIASGDLDSALVHGWNVLRLCIAPDSRAEALVNMAEICRLCGEHDAAMRVFSMAMEWTSQPHVRLHAMSGALQSAVSANHLSVARHYVAELEKLLPTMPNSFTRASVGVEIADSLYRLGDTAAARIQLEDSRTLAASNAYHEVVHRAEQTARTWDLEKAPKVQVIADRRRTRTSRSENVRMVLRSLKGLTSATP